MPDDIQKSISEVRFRSEGRTVAASLRTDGLDDYELDKTTLLSVRVKDGVTSEARALSSVEECPDADYIVTGKYSAWKGIVQAKLEPLRAIMTPLPAASPSALTTRG